MPAYTIVQNALKNLASRETLITRALARDSTKLGVPSIRQCAKLCADAESWEVPTR